MNISVLIITLNEEVNLLRCLEAVSWSDDIVVFDSFSSDSTVAIAKAFGARVIQHRSDNERELREASLRVGFKNEWVFNPDADEVPTPELIAEMMEAIKAPGELVAFRVRFKNMFMGRWIRYSSLYPTWIVRLFKPECLSFERTTNLAYIVNGKEARLHEHLIHYSFDKGLACWFEKHNRYSTHEAYETVLSKSKPLLLKELFKKEPVRRRRALKLISMRLPCRPVLRFVFMYFVCGGFRDGWAGLRYCRLLQIYEALIVHKLAEIAFAEQSRSQAIMVPTRESHTHARR